MVDAAIDTPDPLILKGEFTKIKQFSERED